MSPILLFLSRIVSAVLVPSAFYVHFRVSLLITKEKKPTEMVHVMPQS